MPQTIKIADKTVGDSQPVFLIAEIGINHNASLELAKQLIDLASIYGFDAVKFQKRTPEICVPMEVRDTLRETPWGTMTYFDYKKKMEFGKREYRAIDSYCKKKNILWFASPWDIPSVDFLEEFNVPCHKVPSALLTDDEFLIRLKKTKKPIIVSTGMSTIKEIDHALSILGSAPVIILHCTSTYPAVDEELNLKAIESLRKRYKKITGYSGHESGIMPSVIAVAAYGAAVVERHITKNRSMWGSDHAASLEGRGMELLVREIRRIPTIAGDGKKRVYESEKPILAKLRPKK